MSLTLTTTQNRPTFFKKHRIAIISLAIALIASGAFLVSTLFFADEHTRALKREGDDIAKVSQQAVKKAAAYRKLVDQARANEQAVERDPTAAIKPSHSLVEKLPCDTSDPTCILVVVNKKHPIEPQDYAPDDLTVIDGATLKREAADHYAALVQAARSAGFNLSATSSFRSYDNQIATYAQWSATNGSSAAADTVSARPGYSEHQTGLVVDVKVDGCALECFADTPSYTWMTQHAAQFGFIQRYPTGLTPITGYSAEAWHWRYVGQDTAERMQRFGIKTLEEYLGVTGGDYAV